MNAAEEHNVIQMPINETQTSPYPAPAQDPTGLGNIDKIRDILFGSNMRDYERRFIRLEEKLLKESADVREDVRRRYDALEQFIKHEIASLGDRLRAENQQRLQASDDLTRELRDSTRNLWQKLNQFEEHSSNTHSELRQQILDQMKNLSDEIRHKHDELSAAISREAGELRHDKTDRSALASLFSEFALRLNHEFKLPGDES
jgi:uncharacterized protein YicC (UPF0701 family)